MGLLLICWEIGEITIIDRFEQAVVTSTIMQQMLFSLLGIVVFELSMYLWMTEYSGRAMAQTKQGTLQAVRRGESIQARSQSNVGVQM